ncbi:MAG: S41 family peptidase, partial [Verrucomicrobiota bacterium]|nr:S41 family peptidase [Verrucomicrobiota bacterium]
DEASPFRAEILDDRIGYLRLGALTKSNVVEMDAALQNVVHKSLKAVILDLRATPTSSDFDLAADVIKRFTPKGKMLFTIKKPSAKQERIVTSNQEPQFHGVIVAVVDRETAGAAEVIAAVLRIHASALIVGAKTKGAAVEFADLPLRTGKIVRLAVAEITLPGNASIFPGGVKPDIAIEISDAQKREIMQASLEKGISQFVFENERPRMNEAALVAGTNPEVDAMQAAQRNRTEKGRPALHDAVLQRAVDLITSIGVFEARPSPEQK